MVRSKSALVAPIADGDADELDHLAGVVADDMDAEHLVAAAVDDELHQHAVVAAGQRRLHRPEARLVDVEPSRSARRATASVRPTVPISGVEKTAVGISEWSTMVGRAAEHGVGEGVALADRDRRQVDPVR